MITIELWNKNTSQTCAEIVKAAKKDEEDFCVPVRCRTGLDNFIEKVDKREFYFQEIIANWDQSKQVTDLCQNVSSKRCSSKILDFKS